MYAPCMDSTMFIQGPFGWRIPRFPQGRAYVYLIHFREPYKHARHYCGFTTNLDARLTCHRHGNGARLMEVVTDAGIEWELARLWPVASCEEGHVLERRLKRRHDGPGLCPICAGKPVDVLVALRQGHWPLALHAWQGRRQPMGEHRPVFVRRAPR
jgi:predicted GIY-YIG superfamily endonuclease